MIAIDDMLNGNISSVKTIDTNNRNPASNIFLNAGGIPTPPK